MSILDQIKNIMYKKSISDQGYKINYFSMINSILTPNINYFIILIDKEGRNFKDQFTSEKEVATFLNRIGFKIYTENKS